MQNYLSHNNLFSCHITLSNVTWNFMEYYTTIACHQNLIFSKSNFFILIEVAHSTEKIRNWLLNDTRSWSHSFLKLDLS